MALKRKRSKVEQARELLKGATLPNDESDEELGDDLPWEWIYEEEAPESVDEETEETRSRRVAPGRTSSGVRIVGARNGNFECRIGDIVMLKAPGNEAWVAIVCDLSEGEMEDDEGEDSWDKKATFMWFTSEKDIVRGPKKRMDFLPNELYATSQKDENSLKTINGKATVVSQDTFLARYPSGKVPKTSKDYGKIFVCRRGVAARTSSYTDEFVFEDVYSGEADIQPFSDLIDRQTLKSRKRKTPAKATKDLDDFVVGDNDDDEPHTPRKKRKTTLATTPTSRHKHLSPTKKLMTPTHRRIITKKPLEFTPLGTRILDPNNITASPHQLARSTLHVSAVPHALPCRETEFDAVSSYLEAAITAGTGACIYISGTPGTGKTATVREVVAGLHAAVAQDELDDFVFVEINGMKVTDAHQSYSLLWEVLKGERVSASHALELLEREFSTPSPRRVPCVVLMDELDQLVTRNQGVMYNFFNWPQLRHSRLIVLAVANTMDLPERTLSNKISSRLGLTRITFPGYTHQQLIRIIESRLEGVGQVVVEPDAVQFASRKVAAVSGDARRALDICRRAVEIAEAEVFTMAHEEDENAVPGTPSKTPGRAAAAVASKPKGKQGVVTIATIKKAINEATSTPLAAYLRSLPLASKLFLAALLARLRRTGIGEAVLADVVDEARRMGMMSQLAPVEDFLLAPDALGQIPAETEFARAVATPLKRGRHALKKDVERAARIKGMGVAAMELAEAGIVGLESRRGERVGRVRLGVGEEDVRGALREDEECKGLGFGG